MLSVLTSIENVQNYLFLKLFEQLCQYVVFQGPVLNAKNINADTPKILTPTHFSDPKDINAKKWVVGVVP